MPSNHTINDVRNKAGKRGKNIKYVAVVPFVVVVVALYWLKANYHYCVKVEGPPSPSPACPPPQFVWINIKILTELEEANETCKWKDLYSSMSFTSVPFQVEACVDKGPPLPIAFTNDSWLGGGRGCRGEGGGGWNWYCLFEGGVLRRRGGGSESSSSSRGKGVVGAPNDGRENTSRRCNPPSSPPPPPSPLPLRPFTPPSVALLSPSPVTAAIHHSTRHSAYCLTGDKCTRFTRRAGLPLAGYPRSRMLPLLFTPP